MIEVGPFNIRKKPGDALFNTGSCGRKMNAAVANDFGGVAVLGRWRQSLKEKDIGWFSVLQYPAPRGIIRGCSQLLRLYRIKLAGKCFGILGANTEGNQ